jgi:capsular exopolysaccharide synthesis family protein
MPSPDANKPSLPSRPLQPIHDTIHLSAPMMAGVPPVAGEPAPAGPPGLSAAPTVTALMHALRRRWLLAVGLALLGAFAAVAAVLVLLPARYVVTAKLKLSSFAAPTIFTQRHEHHGEGGIWKANQEALLKSPLVLTRALDSDKVKGLPAARESVGWLEGALKVDFLLGPEIMRVTLSGDDPESLAPLLTAVIDAYLDELNQQEMGKRMALLKELEGSQNGYQTKLWKAEDELRKEERRLGIDDPETAKFKYNLVRDRLTAMEKEYRDLRAELGKKQRDLKALQARAKNLDSEPVPAQLIDKVLRESPLAQAMLRQLEALEAQAAEIARTARDPERFLQGLQADRENLLGNYDRLRRRLRPQIEEQVRAELHETLRTDMARLQGDIDTLTFQNQGMDETVKKMDEEVKRLDPANQPRTPVLEKLRGDVLLTGKALDNLMAEIAKLKIEPPARSRVVVLQAPATPTAKDHSRQVKLAAAGAFGVFGLMLFGVSLWEFRSRRVSGPAEVAQGLGINLLGTLPALSAKARRPLPAANGAQRWQAVMTESVDAVRTLLLHQARGEGLQVIMVTSASSGEGKTSVASQLAASLARAWRKTLLIDGDLRNPAAHKLFEVPLEPGLSEVLRAEVNPTDAVRPTPLSRLWLMPAGSWDSHAVQALAQDRVGGLFGPLKEQYEFIIVDSCPVLPVADSLLLAQHVDGVIFSVLRDVSRLPAVHAAHQRLGALNVRNLGAVVIGGDDAAATAYPYPAVTAS